MSKIIKYLVLNLTKEVEDLYIEIKKQNILMKENLNDTDKGNDILCSWIRELTLLKCPYCPEWFTDWMQFLLKCLGVLYQHRKSNP